MLEVVKPTGQRGRTAADSRRGISFRRIGPIAYSGCWLCIDILKPHKNVAEMQLCLIVSVRRDKRKH